MKMTTQLVLAIVAGQLPQRLATSDAPADRRGVSPISPSISACGARAATESTTTTSIAPERTSASVISSACSPVSGWETSMRVDVHAERLRHSTGSSACSASIKATSPPHLLRLARRCAAPDGRLTGGLRPVDLDDAPLRDAADAERRVQRERARRDGLDGHLRPVAEAHDRALAKVLLDLIDCRLEGLFFVVIDASFSGFSLLHSHKSAHLSVSTATPQSSSAAFAESFHPIHRFGKLERHKVFLRFPILVLQRKSFAECS